LKAKLLQTRAYRSIFQKTGSNTGSNGHNWYTRRLADRDDSHPRIEVALENDGKEEMLPVTDPRVEEALVAEYGKTRDDVTGLPSAFVTALACCEDSGAEDEAWRRADDISDSEGCLDFYRRPPPPPAPKRRGLRR
jgi:hypothetical protein